MIDREYVFALWLLVIFVVMAIVYCASAGELVGVGVFLVVLGLLLREIRGKEGV